MTAYATRTDLYSLALPQASLADVSDADQDAALEAASRMADSYLGAKFELPLTSYGVDLRKAVCKIAAYEILSVRGYSPEHGDSDKVAKDNDASIAWLRDIAKGVATPFGIVDSSGGKDDTDAAGAAQNPAQVVQPYGASQVQSSFWDQGSCATSGGVGPPKSRGW